MVRWCVMAAALATVSPLAASPTMMPTIAITPAVGLWSATYALTRPTRTLVFARSPDTSRVATWTAPAGFEIARGPAGEEVRRRDGAAFTSVTLRMPARYRYLPMDYAPFSPFGDGGMLFHTGRLFACPGPCPAQPRWHLSLAASAPARIIVDGGVRRRIARWRDAADGRTVYVGPGKLTTSGNLVAVVDGALPAPIRAHLDADLPRFMRFYTAHLGTLRQPPMLFVSYDAAYREGWGRQGGTLPGQVFVHFYGPGWPERMAAADFGFDLAWHLAHETAHLYQRGLVEPGDGNDWVHEGAAEAAAAIVLERLDPATASQVAARVRLASDTCATATRDRSLRAVIAGGKADAAYRCGLVLNLALHRAMSSARPGSDGLFAVWRAYLAGRKGRKPFSYTDAVAAVAGRCLADALATSVVTPGAATGVRLATCAGPVAAREREVPKHMAPGTPV